MTRIVIVGNDTRTSDILAGIARELTPHVHHCADGLEALDVLRTHPDCDLVVTGLHMPRLGGLSLLRAIRQDHRVAGVPVIVAANATCPSEVNEVLAAGATVFLGMPFSMGAVRGLLAEYLGTGLTAAV